MARVSNSLYRETFLSHALRVVVEADGAPVGGGHDNTGEIAGLLSWQSQPVAGRVSWHGHAFYSTNRQAEAPGDKNLRKK